MRRLDKAQMRQRGRELRALLNEWDPIGVGPNGPADEYDCLLWDIMRRLERQVSEADLSSFLADELEQHFGLRADLAGVEGFVSRARSWFEKSWKDSLA
jgi:hypothetical protein